MKRCLALVGFVVLTHSATTDWDCVWEGAKGTYDLCDFELTDETSWGYYEVHDERRFEGSWSHYAYFFNVGQNLQQNPPSAVCYNDTLRVQRDLSMGPCTVIDHIDNPNITNSSTACRKAKDIIPITNIGAAYQIKVAEDAPNQFEDQSCWRLHDGVTDPVWQHMLEGDPAYGVKITYENGDFDGGCKVNRAFEIRMLCSNDIENKIDLSQNVTEPELCFYAFEFSTNHGCPIECPVVNDILCNGKGICDYDFTRKKPKCFCYTGYFGDSCDTMKDPDEEVVVRDSTSAYTGALVVVILLLFVILVILGYLMVRKSKLGGTGYIDASFLQKIKKKAASAGKKGKQIQDEDEYTD